jgi:hypothetical protein
MTFETFVLKLSEKKLVFFVQIMLYSLIFQIVNITLSRYYKSFSVEIYE